MVSEFYWIQRDSMPPLKKKVKSTSDWDKRVDNGIREKYMERERERERARDGKHQIQTGWMENRKFNYSSCSL